ncbi:SecY subunit domain-containing protein [Phellopilus nigrolimitatus]|nr:SecY subunit domain-containing protein [Phellopilus nigrolimitatus]
MKAPKHAFLPAGACALTLLIFLACSQIHIYGNISSDSSDALYWTRVILASKRDTLVELGTSPIVTSGMTMQLLAGANLINVDFSLSKDREPFGGTQKLFAFVISLGLATVYVLIGLYGSLSHLVSCVFLLLIFQLVAAMFISSYSASSDRLWPWFRPKSVLSSNSMKASQEITPVLGDQQVRLLSPPHTLHAALLDHNYTVIHGTFIMPMCTSFS